MLQSTMYFHKQILWMKNDSYFTEEESPLKPRQLNRLSRVPNKSQDLDLDVIFHTISLLPQ